MQSRRIICYDFRDVDMSAALSQRRLMHIAFHVARLNLAPAPMPP